MRAPTAPSGRPNSLPRFSAYDQRHTPSLRRHPALKGVAIPAALGVAGAPGVVATAGGLVFAGGGDLALHAIDSATGADVWRTPLPRRANGTPMTYRSTNGRQFIVVATGGGEDAALVAFALNQAAVRQ